MANTTNTQSAFDHVQVGDYVGFKYGAGDESLDNIFIALRVEYSRFGTSLVVKDTQGNIEYVSKFTTVGVGCYYIGAALPQ